jgi:2-hydroxychromene-2-carboxylate isomerase
MNYRSSQPDQTMLDFFFDFASTYSYLAAMRIGQLAQAKGVEVRWRPFLLGPIFKEKGWTTSPFNLYPDKGRYMWRDLERSAAALGLPFRRPDPFPQPSLLAARVALVGLSQCWGEAFCRAAFAAEFGDGRAIADTEDMADLLRAIAVSPEQTLARAQSEDIKTKLRAETAAAQQLGIFGAPSFVTEDGELFWGNDRLEQALAWAKDARE